MRKIPHGLTLTSFLLMASCIPQNYEESLSYHVWPTYQTAKVVEATDRNSSYNKLPAVSLEMMQGVTESGQFIVTSSRQASFYLSVSDLVSSKDRIPSSAVSLFFAKTLEIKSASNGNSFFRAGDRIPDLLLPIEVATKAKENVLYAGNNSFFVEVDSSGLTEGKYEGSIKLTVEGKETTIPIIVTVYNFSLAGRRRFQSSFLIYRNELLAGEYDNGKATVDSYRNALLTHKVDSYLIQPAFENTVERFLNDVKLTFADKNCASIAIPYDFPLTYTAGSDQRVIDYLVELAKISTPENPYLDYAYFYPSSYDEADINNERMEACKGFFGRNGQYEKTLVLAKETLIGDPIFQGFDLQWRNHLKQRMTEIPAIFTNVNFKEKWVKDYVATFCPYVSALNDYSIRQKYSHFAKENQKGNLWVYSCSGPLYPYPTFHLDDRLSAMRVNGWMNKAMGVNGYLYYAVNKYTVAPEKTEDTFVDPYETAARYENINGDGYLLYPGYRYGLNHPLPSVRLATYRDSQNDFDMLCVYEDRLKDLGNFYGTEFKLDDYVGDLYRNLFSGTVAYQEEAKIFEAKKILAKRITLASNEDRLFSSASWRDGKRTITFYSPVETFKVDGVTVAGMAAGSGYAYSLLSNENHQYAVKVGEREYRIDFPEATAITDFSTNSSLEVNKNESSSVLFTNGRLKAKIVSEYRDKGTKIEEKTKSFHPFIELPISELKGSSLSFDLANVGGVEAYLDFQLVQQSGIKTNLQSFWLASGEQERMTLDLSHLSFPLDKIKSLRLSFSNVETIDGEYQLLAERNVSLTPLIDE